MKYTFYFTIDIPDDECSEENLNNKFQKVADAIQEVCPFDDDEWDFCARGFDYT